MGIGGLGGSRPKVQVSNAATAYYPDGSRAGVHKGRPTKLHDTKEVSGRVCFKPPYLSSELCHDKSDLQEVEDRF
jgi:hypothetical protein